MLLIKTLLIAAQLHWGLADRQARYNGLMTIASGLVGCQAAGRVETLATGTSPRWHFLIQPIGSCSFVPFGPTPYRLSAWNDGDSFVTEISGWALLRIRPMDPEVRKTLLNEPTPANPPSADVTVSLQPIADGVWELLIVQP